MVGEGRMLVLEEILNEKQIHHILKQIIGDQFQRNLKWSEVKPATDGIAGFLGDHMKAVLHVDFLGKERQIHLFIKRLPASNKPKVDFINEFNFFRREMLMYKILEEIDVKECDPWCVKAYLYTDSIIVMRDLALEGYSIQHYLDTLDREHVFVTATSMAHFHAALVNYETKKSIELQRPYSTFQEFKNIMSESTFCDSPWMRACAKLSTNLLKTFSTKWYRNLPDLESKLTRLYIEACDTVTEYKDNLNVVLHSDPWVNNILFKYENDIPVNAILVDYQCLRYGPPAFDLVMVLYLTTDRQFRQEHEKDIFDHYYAIFAKNLNDDSKKRLERIGYDKELFLKWCEVGRKFAMLQAVAIYPFILMDPKTAQKTFDDPETYEKYINEDRSEPVIDYANKCEAYKQRNLTITEEFVETFVLKQM